MTVQRAVEKSHDSDSGSYLVSLTPGVNCKSSIKKAQLEKYLGSLQNAFVEIRSSNTEIVVERDFIRRNGRLFLVRLGWPIHSSIQRFPAVVMCCINPLGKTHKFDGPDTNSSQWVDSITESLKIACCWSETQVLAVDNDCKYDNEHWKQELHGGKVNSLEIRRSTVVGENVGEFL